MKVKSWDVFLSGEIVDLIVPEERAIEETNWYRWFNNPSVNAELAQGMFPSSAKSQQAFLSEIMSPESTRLALLIWAKDVEKVIGVLSLSSIDFKCRIADVAVVIGEKTGSSNSLFYGLEAKARLVEHAFETMGLERIKSGQSFAHRNWQNIQMLFGFRPEGVLINGFRKGRRVNHSIITACNLEDYLRVKEKRSGDYWPGKAKLYELMKLLPREPITNSVHHAISKVIADFESQVTWS